MKDEKGFLYYDVVYGLSIMMIFFSVFFTVMSGTVQQYGHIMKEDACLQRMILYMEEAKQIVAQQGTLDETTWEPLDDYTFHVKSRKGPFQLQQISLHVYKGNREVHHLYTYVREEGPMNAYVHEEEE